MISAVLISVDHSMQASGLISTPSAADAATAPLPARSQLLKYDSRFRSGISPGCFGCDPTCCPVRALEVGLSSAAKRANHPTCPASPTRCTAGQHAHQPGRHRRPTKSNDLQRPPPCYPQLLISASKSLRHSVAGGAFDQKRNLLFPRPRVGKNPLRCRR